MSLSPRLYLREIVTKEGENVPIDFMVAKSKKEICKSKKRVHFPEKIHSYFIHNQNDFTNYPTMLNELTDIGDVLLSENEVKHLLNFCEEVQALTEIISDYRIFDKWKSFKIRQQDLIDFVSGFSNLLRYAIEHNESVWSVGE